MATPRPSQEPLSIVTVVMNRSHHLRHSAPLVARWPRHAEHLILDWSSRVPVTAADLPDDPRIRLVRVEGEQEWSPGRSFNLAFALARHPLLLRLDGDSWPTDPQLELPPLAAGHYRRLPIGGGLTGLLLIHREDLWAVGGFNERLSGYGFEDKDLDRRLADRFACELLPEGSFATLPHDHRDRSAAFALGGSPAWALHQARALMEESKARNRVIAEYESWSAQQPRLRYGPLPSAPSGEVLQRLPGQRAVIPGPLQERLETAGTGAYLEAMFWIPQEQIQSRIPPPLQQRLRRSLRLQRLHHSLFVPLVLGLIGLLHRLLRWQERLQKLARRRNR